MLRLTTTAERAIECAYQYALKLAGPLKARRISTRKSIERIRVPSGRVRARRFARCVIPAFSPARDRTAAEWEREMLRIWEAAGRINAAGYLRLTGIFRQLTAQDVHAAFPHLELSECAEVAAALYRV